MAVIHLVYVKLISPKYLEFYFFLIMIYTWKIIKHKLEPSWVVAGSCCLGVCAHTS